MIKSDCESVHTIDSNHVGDSAVSIFFKMNDEDEDTIDQKSLCVCEVLADKLELLKETVSELQDAWFPHCSEMLQVIEANELP